MARETKAERLVREQAEREARLETERQEYPARLMVALERVSNESSLEFSVKDGLFNVLDRDASEYSYNREFDLSYSWNPSTQEALLELEYKLDDLDRERAEARRRVEVKKEAERKVRELLSDEERELLGLQ